MFALHIAINMWKTIRVKGRNIEDDALFYTIETTEIGSRSLQSVSLASITMT
jgi:hypothetical protein